MKVLKSVVFGGLLTGVLFFQSPAQAEFKGSYVGDIKNYTAKYEDTFVHLARKNNLGFTELRAANPGVDPWIPGSGTRLVLPTRHLLPSAPRNGIVINLPEMRVYAYINGDQPPISYAIGIGREGLSTPVGETRIVSKIKDPIWRPTPRMRKEKPELPAEVPPGPDNPLGTHALYLGWPEYRIHGTNHPYGIGRRVSSGCIRLYPEAIGDFFNRIPVGTPVNVVNEPIRAAWIGDELYLEADPDVEQSIKLEVEGVLTEKKLTSDEIRKIADAAGPYQDRLNWPKIRMAVKERLGYPVVIARRPGAGGNLKIEASVVQDVDIMPVNQMKRPEKTVVHTEPADQQAAFN